VIFQPEHCDWIVQGDKTQTRRAVKPGETRFGAISFGETETLCVRHPDGRTKWKVGGRYGVQTGFGFPATAWFKVTDIRQERLQDISPEDVIEEGFGVWQGDYHQADVAAFSDAWDAIYAGQPECQWDANPLVWVLVFEV